MSSEQLEYLFSKLHKEFREDILENDAYMEENDELKEIQTKLELEIAELENANWELQEKIKQLEHELSCHERQDKKRKLHNF